MLKTIANNSHSLGTGSKLNLHKKFSSHPGRLLNVLCTFNVRSVSMGRILRGSVKYKSSVDYFRPKNYFL